MNLIQLKYFQTVSNFQSMTKAAEFLNITQPSLSLAIKELEKEFGVTLFRRHRHGMGLTEEGMELLKLADSLLAHAEEVQRHMTDLGEKRKVLRLGVPPMIGSLMLTKIYDEFAVKNPDVQLEISEAGRQELMEMLSESRLDMVFLPHNTPFDTSFKTLKIAPFEIVCAVKKGAKINASGTVKAKDLEGKPLVLFKDNFFQTNEIKKWFKQGGVEPEILLQTDQLSTLQKLITSGVATGFMFRELISGNPEIEAIPLVDPIPVRVSLVWKANVPIFSAMKKFMSYMK